MHRVAWVSDPHLNFLQSNSHVANFGEAVLCEHAPRTVIMTGDIGEYNSFVRLLKRFNDGLQCGSRVNLCFVVGNHDAYGGSIQGARMLAANLSATSEDITYLTTAGVVELTPSVALVGHDGWYDARHGDPFGSTVRMADFTEIVELSTSSDRDREERSHGRRPLYRDFLVERVRTIADKYAQEARISLRSALGRYKTVVFATHVPPFVGAVWHEGNISNGNFLPWFTNKAMGDMLTEEADDHQDRKILVLCGHSHSGGECNPRSNLRVLTASAQYGLPAVYKAFDFN